MEARNVSPEDTSCAICEQRVQSCIQYPLARGIQDMTRNFEHHQDVMCKNFESFHNRLITDLRHFKLDLETRLDCGPRQTTESGDIYVELQQTTESCDRYVKLED
mmetsp:Transcript_118631/g.335547  ORF Transcript_118631/g.335547 Transcript_118631/m.335547 type:complete len:105 (+) Transcript_118631:37-351(+)